MLIDINTNKPILLPEVHGNTKIRNLITGKYDKTVSQWRKAARQSAIALKKRFEKTA